MNDSPVDAEIWVSIDERDPSIAVLQPGIDRFPSLFLICLLPFHCVVGMLLLFRRHLQNRSDMKTLLANMLQDEGACRATRRPLLRALDLRFARPPLDRIRERASAPEAEGR